jgi:hypothetical protein
MYNSERRQATTKWKRAKTPDTAYAYQNKAENLGWEELDSIRAYHQHLSVFFASILDRSNIVYSGIDDREVATIVADYISSVSWRIDPDYVMRAFQKAKGLLGVNNSIQSIRATMVSLSKMPTIDRSLP